MTATPLPLRVMVLDGRSREECPLRITLRENLQASIKADWRDTAN